ncbi:MAG: hypothetical protein PVI06_05920 [Desulfobacterales bacterium]|jgi:hypothetical protein
MNKPLKEEFVKISVLENTIEAQLVESVLLEQNIPHRIQSFHDTAYNGLFQFQKGWGAIWAPEKYKEIIIEILTDVRTTDKITPADPIDP